MAGRGTDIPLGDGVKQKGGLYVLGTERHEARRIDNQLRGRSGRQGDPGLSRFYVSLEDQIMKIQGGDVVKRIMEMTNIPDDMPIESRLVSNSIERSQKRMEGMYFDSRKRVVEYDDVVNQQREIFYARRLRYLMLAEEFTEANKLDDGDEKEEKQNQAKQRLKEQFKEVIEDLASKYAAQVVTEDGEKIDSTVDEILSLGQDDLFIETVNHLKLFKDEISDTEQLKNVLVTQIKDKIDDENELVEFIENLLRTAIDKKIDAQSNLDLVVKSVFLDVMDELWTLHLDYMQDLREGIGLRGVAQLDPLTEYKNEGFVAFSDFIARVDNQALQGLLQAGQYRKRTEQQQKLITNADQIVDLLTGNREISASGAIAQATGAAKAKSGGKKKLSRRERRRAERKKKK
jgi:preprotein translocase subunit SecA